MKVAIIHYWLVNMRGGEKVLESLCEMYPEADIYTHVYDPDSVSSVINSHDIRTTFIDWLPFRSKLYKYYLPLMPMALSFLQLKHYDLVISSESGPAKGVVVGASSKHICYCHTPMRYVWDMYDEYRENAGFIVGSIMRLLVRYLRAYDLKSVSGVDQFVSNSAFVGDRIARIYNRSSVVVYPPVSVDKLHISENVSDYYLYVGELTYYKQPHLVVDAFNRSGRKLVIVGDGELMPQLVRTAHRNIQIVGKQSDDALRRYYSECKALIFPGVEDFGIVPVEAMASGRPVIAYRKGGAVETVIEGVTGCFFDQQSASALNAAIDQFETGIAQYSPETIVRHAGQFTKQRFQREMQLLVTDIVQS